MKGTVVRKLSVLDLMATSFFYCNNIKEKYFMHLKIAGIQI